MDNQNNAPGCFGAATVFAHDSEVCRSCCAFDSCASESAKTLEQIKGIVNVTDILARHRRAKAVANARLKQRDEEEAALRPPGGVDKPLPKEPVERKTKLAKVEITEQDGNLIAQLKGHTKAMALQLLHAHYITGIKEGLKRGENYMTGKTPTFICKTVELLLAAGSFTKTSLREHFIQQFNWKQTTAQPHVTIVTQIFAAFEIAQEIDGEFVVHPKLRA